MTEEEKNRQIPTQSMLAVRDRMAYGYTKHGDYLKRLETRSKEDLWNHAMWHIDQIKNGEQFTGSGDLHIIASICDLMLVYEKDLMDGTLTGEG
jgi:hypothetical protein